ncbi:hypothetical protein K1719_002034 [Acacia pycnantha]|nr:hypothetical protein K1719_002034 [Acacia pycnantha]
MKAAMKANIPFIPNDILDNIFKRLPVRPLIRFQFVCKNWKDLIEDLIKTSIEDRLHYCSYNDPSLSDILEQCQRICGGIRFSEQDCDVALDKVQKLPPILPLFNFEVVGSSNGLVCLQMIENRKDTNLLLIWNPVTRDIREVSLRTIFLRDRLGFGFSPIDNDYKIVRIVCQSSYIKSVEVYSLNHRSWKVDLGGDLKGTQIILWGSVNVNGVMFWDTTESFDDNLIFSFDLSKQVCRLIQKPYNRLYYSSCLIEYENKLAMVAPFRYEQIHLWVMEKDTCKWTKIYISDPCPCDFLYPVTIWRNEIVLDTDEIGLHTENDGETKILYLLNPATNKFKRLALH